MFLMVKRAPHNPEHWETFQIWWEMLFFNASLFSAPRGTGAYKWFTALKVPSAWKVTKNVCSALATLCI